MWSVLPVSVASVVNALSVVSAESVVTVVRTAENVVSVLSVASVMVTAVPVQSSRRLPQRMPLRRTSATHSTTWTSKK